MQEHIFGRLLTGKPDAALGFKKLENAVYGRYPMVVHTNNLEDKVAGMAYEVNDSDLKKRTFMKPALTNGKIPFGIWG